MLEWRSMTHTTMRCFWLKSMSCMRSVASSLSPNKAMFLLTERWDNQPPETRHRRSFYQTFCQPTAQIWTRLTTKLCEKCSSWSSKFMTSMNWSSAWSMSGIFQAKHHRWRRWLVAQMSLRVNLCERKAFRAFNSIPISHMLLVNL